MSNRTNPAFDQNRDRDRDNTYKGTIEDAKNDLAKMKTYMAAIKNGEINDMYKTSAESLIDSIYKKYPFLKPREIPEVFARLESISAKSILAQHSEDLEYDISEVISNNFPEQNFNHPAEQNSNHPAGPRYFNHPAEQNSNHPAGPRYFNYPAEPSQAIHPAGHQIIYALPPPQYYLPPPQTNQAEMKIGRPANKKFIESKKFITKITFIVLCHFLNYGTPDHSSSIYSNMSGFNRCIENESHINDLFRYFKDFLRELIENAEKNKDSPYSNNVNLNKVRTAVGHMLGIFLDYVLDDEIFEKLNILYNTFLNATKTIEKRATSIDYVKGLLNIINGRF